MSIGNAKRKCQSGNVWLVEHHDVVSVREIWYADTTSQNNREEEVSLSGSSTIKCPSCGSYLAFTPGTQSITCPYCGTSVSEEDFLHTYQPAEEAQPPTPEPSSADNDEKLRSYHCSNCGAEIVTGDTTAATSCYYCHSPVVLSDRLSSGYKPDGVIPFALDRKKAEEAFTQFLQSKRFVDRDFFSQASLKHFNGVYYPYWVGDVAGSASFEGEGTQVSTHRGATADTVVTRYYRVVRAGEFEARNLTRKALKAVDRQLSDGIHPYRDDGIKPYSPAYLSGFLAERRDLEKDDVRGDMEREADRLAKTAIYRSASGYASVTGNSDFIRKNTSMRYVLMPAWTLTYQGKGENIYYYMMNGQTGTVCGKLPINKGKLWLTGLISGGLVSLVLLLGGAFLW